MTPADYDFLVQFLKAQSGLTLAGEKMYLIDARLIPVAKRFELPSLDALVGKIRAKDASVAQAVVEAMTTNETFFFRDRTPFDNFGGHILSTLSASRKSQGTIRVWCAAASSGQEPYSLAMIVQDQAAMLAGLKTEIVATDISQDILKRATDGLYTQFEVQRGLPVHYLVKYFSKQGEQWKVKDEIHQMVQFRTLNLLDPFATIGKFDVIFCRNVLIYFDEPTKRQVLERISKQLANDGFLVLGAAETVVGITDALVPSPDARGVYLKRQTAADECQELRNLVSV